MASGPVPSISVSYAGELVAVAWGWSGAVGIDVETTSGAGDGIDRQEWTLVEAAFKAGAASAEVLDLPAGFVGAVAGEDVSWRLAGPAAPSR